MNAAAPPGGDGSAERPFKTISSAILAATAGPGSAAPKRVHVAKGTHDRALGEEFPLRLRGISIEGAGQGETVISGLGAAVTVQGTAQGGTIYPTVVFGDDLAESRLSNLTIQAAPSAPPSGGESVGVVCDRGGPAGATWIDSITVDGFTHDLLVAGETGASGCSLTLTASTLENAPTGIWTAGRCSTSPSVTLTIGRSSAGNTFRNIRASGLASGAGLALGSCLQRGAIEDNVFLDSDIGIDFQETIGDPSGSLAVNGNSFENLARFGLRLVGPAALDALKDNIFSGISGRNAIKVDNASLGIGILLVRDPADGTTLPQIRTARGNQLVANDAAIEVGPGTLTGPVDFGTGQDPGQNTFRCNSAPALWAEPSGDVRWFARIGDGGVFSLSGNVWDHAPPTLVESGNPARNGTDVQLFMGGSYVPDTGGATAGPPQCPLGRVP